MRQLLWIPVFAMAAASGCGYHLGGRGDLVPKTVQTIAVQPFGNATAPASRAKLCMVMRSPKEAAALPMSAELMLSEASKRNAIFG